MGGEIGVLKPPHGWRERRGRETRADVAIDPEKCEHEFSGGRSADQT